MNTQLHPIDFENWDRRQYFYYFTEMLPTGFNLNIEIDITKAHQKIKAAGKKFFPAYLYLTAKLITEQSEFRVAKTADKLGFMRFYTPPMPVFTRMTKRCRTCGQNLIRILKAFIKTT